MELFFILLIVVAFLAIGNRVNNSPRSVENKRGTFIKRLVASGLKPDAIDDFKWRFDKGLLSSDDELSDFIYWALKKQQSEKESLPLEQLQNENKESSIIEKSLEEKRIKEEESEKYEEEFHFKQTLYNANLRDSVAQCALGKMYLNGRGVDQNYVEAHKWFSIAGACGSKEWERNRDICENRMTSAQIIEANRLSFQWNSECEEQWREKKGQKEIKPLEIIETEPLVEPSQSKKLLYTHSERGTRFCQSCGKEIHALTTYLSEQNDTKIWQDMVFPEEEKVFCSFRCVREE